MYKERYAGDYNQSCFRRYSPVVYHSHFPRSITLKFDNLLLFKRVFSNKAEPPVRDFLVSVGQHFQLEADIQMKARQLRRKTRPKEKQL